MLEYSNIIMYIRILPAHGHNQSLTEERGVFSVLFSKWSSRDCSRHLERSLESNRLIAAKLNYQSRSNTARSGSDEWSTTRRGRRKDLLKDSQGRRRLHQNPRLLSGLRISDGMLLGEQDYCRRKKSKLIRTWKSITLEELDVRAI